MSKLSIKNLDLYYGDFKALKNVNLEIEANKNRRCGNHVPGGLCSLGHRPHPR